MISESGLSLLPTAIHRHYHRHPPALPMPKRRSLRALLSLVSQLPLFSSSLTPHAPPPFVSAPDPSSPASLCPRVPSSASDPPTTMAGSLFSCRTLDLSLAVHEPSRVWEVELPEVAAGYRSRTVAPSSPPGRALELLPPPPRPHLLSSVLHQACRHRARLSSPPDHRRQARLYTSLPLHRPASPLLHRARLFSSQPSLYLHLPCAP